MLRLTAIVKASSAQIFDVAQSVDLA